MQRETAFHIWYVIAAILLLLFLQYAITTGQMVEPIPYSAFETYLHDGKIAEVTVSDHYLKGKFKQPLENGRTDFVTDRVDSGFAAELAKYNVTVSGNQDGGLLRDLTSWIVPTLFFVAIWVFVFRRMSAGGMDGGLMAIGKSKAKIYVEADTKVTFADVAGVDEAKDELKEIVNFLKNPGEYGRLGAHIPKGVLLVGPPGTGKTLLARAVAGEAGVPFFSINGSADGFDSRNGLVLLAATNRPEILDPALLRAGRFDRQVLVDRPDRKGRAQIVAIYLKRIRCSGDVSAESVAELTPGFTGADLANLVNEAALVATRANAAEVTMAHFTAAVERIVAGLEKRNRLLNPHEREAVAFHEMGHALVAMSLPGADVVHKVSIIPRGIGALGYTIQRPTEDRYLMTREELGDKMAVLLGGRAAERLVFGELSTGAADDLAKVTDIARSIVVQYAMEESLGVVYERRSPFLGTPGELAGSARGYSEETARVIDAAVQRITQESFNKATSILKNRRNVLERGARLLLERETLTESELNEVVASEPLLPFTPSAHSVPVARAD